MTAFMSNQVRRLAPTSHVNHTSRFWPLAAVPWPLSCYTELVMAISKDLLEILVCPLCKAALEMKQDENGLKCVQCKRVYPIRDDIPVMLEIGRASCRERV